MLSVVALVKHLAPIVKKDLSKLKQVHHLRYFENYFLHFAQITK
jgi:hypothetical protein